MPIAPNDYFEKKRPWAEIKNRVLGSYLTPYIAKIAKLNRPLIIIDAFSGPGKNFEDNSAGSPLIICSAMTKYKGKKSAYFFNNEKDHHETLIEILKIVPDYNFAKPILGDAVELLEKVVPKITNETVFLYLDPFGLTCTYDTLKPFLERSSDTSTEILINLNMTGLHRLAAHKAHETEQIKANRIKLTKVLGGDYWKDILLSSSDLETKEKERLIVEEYKKKLSINGYLRYTAACPVQENLSSPTKYYMISASPHSDSLLLFNDEMCKAFNDYMHKQENPIFEIAGQDWRSWRDIETLIPLVLEYTYKYPRTTRRDLWLFIVQDHFMKFTESEYKKAVNKAVEDNQILCSTPIQKGGIRPTKRLNDECVLEPL